MPLTLFNSLTRRSEPFAPADPGRITFYSCGPTVYDDAHIGNFRSFLAADILRRWLESPLRDPAAARSPRVVQVMNITDVGHMTDDADGGEAGEDRMAVAGRRLAEAKKAGRLPPGTDVNPADPLQIARFYERRFKDDAVRLGLKVVADGGGPTAADRDAARAFHSPRATENIAAMTAVVARLLERRAHDGAPYAYVAGAAPSRAVYFRVQAFPAYGRLSGNTLERLRAGAGGRVTGANQSQKQHQADFLLWKEDPRHLMRWPSPWGEGYPGWHIECTAMALSRLASTAGPPAEPSATSAIIDAAARVTAALAAPASGALIDLHSGGEDNIFPHHECEIAQSCCAFNADPAAMDPAAGLFARFWFHPRFLLVEGDKMSKSKGNFFTARDLFDRGVEPAAIRLELIRTHYRSNANFTFQGLADSQRMVDRWRRVLAEAPATPTPAPEDAAGHGLVREFADALNDDLNVAAAIAALNRWAGDLATPTGADAAALRAADAVLGVLALDRPAATTTAIGVFAPGVAPSPEVEALLATRRDARTARDFARSDAIRDQLAAMGYAIKDLAGGRVEVRRS